MNLDWSLQEKFAMVPSNIQLSPRTVQLLNLSNASIFLDKKQLF